MRLFNKENKNKETHRLPMGQKSKRALAVYSALVFLLCCCTTTAFAAGDPLTVINNLSDFIFGLIRAIGMILLGFGVVQIGLSLKSHDPSQRANGFLTLKGVCHEFEMRVLYPLFEAGGEKRAGRSDHPQAPGG